MNSKLLVRRQKIHGSLRWCGELAELTVHDIWQIADTGDQEFRRPTHSSRWGTTELGSEDNDGLSQLQHSLRNNQPSASRHASAETDHAHISGSLWPDVLQHFEHTATCPWLSSAQKTKQSCNSWCAMWQRCGLMSLPTQCPANDEHKLLPLRCEAAPSPKVARGLTVMWTSEEGVGWSLERLCALHFQLTEIHFIVPWDHTFCGSQMLQRVVNWQMSRELTVSAEVTSRKMAWRRTARHHDSPLRPQTAAETHAPATNDGGHATNL